MEMHLDAQEREQILKVHNYSLLQWFRQKNMVEIAPYRSSFWHEFASVSVS